MSDKCPYSCMNKTEYGYCKTTACINPNYQNKQYGEIFQPITIPAVSSPCFGCPNSPINGGSGICHCILGTPKVY